MVDIEIDSLTNCLIESKTKKEVNTTFSEIRKTITKAEAISLKEKGWLFDWNIPYKEGFQVYALYAEGASDVQGLIAIKHMREEFYTYISIVESSPANRINHHYLGVGAHLFAIACKLSFEAGNDGYVSFVAKTNLIDYYAKTLGAKSIGGQKMVIDTRAALALVEKYFKEDNL